MSIRERTDIEVNNVTKNIYKKYNTTEHFVKLGRKKIEKLIVSNVHNNLSKPKLLGRVKRLETGTDDYIKILKKKISKSLKIQNMKIVLDCANGAGYKSAPKMIKSLGAKLIIIGNKPNGKNINKKWFLH